jgi:hypothetical protein
VLPFLVAVFLRIIGILRAYMPMFLREREGLFLEFQIELKRV